MSWFQEYKSSLKLIEVEEFLDLVFYRPIAFLFVKAVYKTNLTPNQITSIALIIGMIGGVFYFFNTHYAISIGAVLLIVYDVLDCSDGMIARLKKNGTFFGRILDGIADYFVTVTVYLGIGFGFANNSDNPLFYWTLLALTGASNIVHAATVDFYRNKFMDYAFNRDATLGENLEEFEEESKKLNKSSGKYFQKFVVWIYLKYSAAQLAASAEKDSTNVKKYDRDDYLKKNRIILHLWTYIGPTTELTLIIVASFFNRLDLFMWVMVIGANLYALILFVMQTQINKKTKLESFVS
ncbi:MAG: CDP-alcohol phosphatidyltransferase family protein [Melioribacteraceae bacterium]|nr:CDP-alcohol phosphatidyltransferase family protein [Melioribacteraceae bacterium]